MVNISCILFAALLATCLAIYPSQLPTRVLQAPNLDLPKPVLVYGAPHYPKYKEAEVPVVSTYTYEIPQVPIKPAEVYGVPVQAPVYGVPTHVVEPAKVYGVPYAPKYESSYKYLIKEEPFVKPAVVYGVPSKPAVVYGVPEQKPAKPAIIYGVPEKTYTKPVTSTYKYTVIDAAKQYIAPKPHDIYGPPKYEVPIFPAKVYGVPDYVQKVVVPTTPVKPVYTKPVISTYTFKLPKTPVVIEPQAVYGVPHTTYGLPV